MKAWEGGIARITTSGSNDCRNYDVMKSVDISSIQEFLLCATPQGWIEEALRPHNLSVLLIDHANCEKKAASTALNLIYRYIDYPELLHKLSRLAREELRHFEQVLSIMEKRHIEYRHVSASRYAAKLREEVSSSDPEKLVDTLICGAIIEARSCERFAALAPLLEEDLKEFYLSLLKSESRHFRDYLKLAQIYIDSSDKLSADYLKNKTAMMLEKERELINTSDPEFRFHSGAPAGIEAATNEKVTAIN